jgi:hypothetical protein
MDFQKSQARRVTLLANDDGTGFLVNHTDGTVGALRAPWWEHRGSPSELLVAHVCQGAVVLERNSFHGIFPEWVSYRGDLPIFLGTDTAERRWCTIWEALINATWKSQDAKVAHHRIVAAYHSVMADLHETWDSDGGDLLTLGYLQACSDLITSSDLIE